MAGEAIVTRPAVFERLRSRARVLATAPFAALATAGAVVFLAARLVHDVGTKPYFEDEAVAAQIATRPWIELLHTVVWTRGGSPLHFAVAHVVLDVDPTAAALRWLSIVCALATVVCAYALGRQLAGGAAGAAAAWVVAASSLLRVYGTFGRMYSLLALLGGLNLLLFLRALERPTRRRVTLAAASAWLLAATHPFALVPVVVEGAIALWLWRGRGWRRATPALVAAAATLPLIAGELRLAGRFDLSTSSGTAIGSGGDASAQLRGAFEGFAGGRGVTLLILTALGVVGTVTVLRRRPFLVLAGASALFVPPALSLVAHVDNTGAAFITPRHLMAPLALWAALIGAGAVRMVRSWRHAPELSAAAVVAVAVLATSAPATARDPRTYFSYWAAIGQVQQTQTVGSWLATRIEPRAFLFPYAVPYLRALPQARHARGLPRAEASTLLAAIGDGRGSPELWVTAPIGPGDRFRVGALATLRRSYQVAVFARWLVLRVRGPFESTNGAVAALDRAVDLAAASLYKVTPDSVAYLATSGRAVDEANVEVNGPDALASIKAAVARIKSEPPEKTPAP